MEERVLANIARVDIITEETTPTLITGTTGTDATLEPYISEGTEQFVRTKNRILGQNNYEDLVLGYNITLKDVAFDPEQFAIVDGGTYTSDEDGYTYDGPAMGTAVARKRVTLDVWTEEKDTDGENVCYHRFRFLHTRGTPVKFTHKDGAFFAPEYVLKSRAKDGEKPIGIKQFDALPLANATASELLAA